MLGGSLQAQTITNIAEARWNSGGQDFSIRSNEVSFDIAPNAAIIETFRLAPGGPTTVNFTPSLCGNPRAPLAIGGTGNAPITVNTSRDFSTGDMLVFEIIAAAANLDPNAVDRLEAVLTNTSGDRETLEIFETGANTGSFVGAIRIVTIPPAPVAGDCRLSSGQGDVVTIEGRRVGLAAVIAATTVNILADPYGLVFDSEDGTPVSGATVTLIDVATGLPAVVFADDGITSWPPTVISGQSVTDSGGTVYPMRPGEYRFPLTSLGQYRLEITPPSPYSAPSVVAAAQLANLTRPDGGAFTIGSGSYGQSFDLVSIVPVRIDIPLDRPSVAVGLTKTASRASAVPGDVVFYTVTVTNPDNARGKSGVVATDTPSTWLRLRQDSVRIDGAEAAGALSVSPDGRKFAVRLGDIAPAARHTITYAMTVRADAPPGDAVNLAESVDSRGNIAKASAVLKIERDILSNRMTIIGRITAGECLLDGPRLGVPGVRVMLEDGSFAITDSEGRYHFEGIVPGTHVVQAAGQTLPEGSRFIDCSNSTRNAGSLNSRFVIGQGGSLVVADFAATLPEGWLKAETLPEPEETYRDAAGAETDWLTLGDGPDDFLFPAIDHNPRAPAIRAVIRHRAGSTVELSAEGKRVDPLTFEGTRTDANGKYAVSIWRGVPLKTETTRLSARILDAKGGETAVLTRPVFFTSVPARAELIAASSKLVADGETRPVVAVRMTDRHGRPLRDGISGQVAIKAPYESAQALDTMQLRQLSNSGGTAPTWTVTGDNGIALIELAPTMVSGPLHLDFNFVEDQITRQQTLETWIVPGDMKWTLVGLAEGAVGSREIADNMERAGNFDSDLGNNARVAFYAKGRILGQYLLTAAYDSAKQRADQPLFGAIDPNAYYTIFADGSDRRFDAASREKLYVRIESARFYALYGDFETGFDQTDLARYVRSATGVKAEGDFGAVQVQGFAAEIATRYRRDEIQGNGLTGPYSLSSRAIIANSERVVLQIRDRFRSELIVSERQLTRFVDYDIDLLSGTITFAQPVLSRDFNFNPQFIVIDYEVDLLSSGGEWNAGLRANITNASETVRVGVTLVTDKGDAARTNLAALDVLARLGETTELRAELGASRAVGLTDMAWQVEAEHHTGDLDILAYARSIDSDYGTGQQNSGERGRRKVGLDGRYAVTEQLTVTGSIWNDDSLTDTTSRRAVQLLSTYTSGDTDLRLGVSHFSDRLGTGERANSTVLEAGATQRLLDNQLELSANSSIALGTAEAIDLPSSYVFGARYALTSNVRLIGAYEIAEGERLKARTVRGGIEVTPWTGGRVVSSLGQQDISEFGKRSFAAFGLAQSFQVSSELALDATLDGNRTLSGGDASKLVNPAQPAASGGQISGSGNLFEDFTAVTLGTAWRKGPWAATARAELRDGELADRTGFTFGAIRQLGEGSVVGSGFAWTRAESDTGQSTEIFDGAISAAHRPEEGEFAFLTKLEYRSDRAVNAVAGETDASGRTALTVTGDAQSRRLIGSLSTNWHPIAKRNEDTRSGYTREAAEIGVFVGARYNFDSYEGFDLAGWSVLGGLEARVAVGERFEVGGTATVRSNISDGTTSFAIGPQIGFTPADNMLLTVGYNVSGFRDDDFSAARNTDKGVFAALRVKFDGDAFGFLGLRR
ncbi:isopeptide-forming domain-containing fimbrial protein [Allopontixanthobacter sediminis]|nr:isopeptide-forming domain-containing fimbrial protein [Allopontixanthobacter sediminis]